jgi:hypothetical protein
MRPRHPRHLRRDRNVALRHKDTGLAFDARRQHRVERTALRAQRAALLLNPENA